MPDNEPPDSRAPRVDWSAVPLVVTDQATCPHCASTRKPHLVRSEANGDETLTAKRICRDCSQPFKELIQFRLPNFGKPPTPAGTIQR